MPKKGSTYTMSIDFDTSQAIQSYRKLITELTKAGADPKVISQLSKSLDTVEKKIQNMQQRAQVGFTNSKEIAKYNSEITDVTNSLIGVGRRINQINSNPLNFNNAEIEQSKKEIQNLEKQLIKLQQTARKDLVSNLQVLGFNKNDATILSKQIKSQEDLNKLLEQEKIKRSQISTEIKKQYDAVKRSYYAEYTDQTSPLIVSSSDFDIVGLAKQFDLTTNEVNELVDAINDNLVKALRMGSGDQEIFNKLNSEFKELGTNIEKFLVPNIDKVREHIEGLVGNRENYALSSLEGKRYQAATISYQQIGSAGGLLSENAQSVVRQYADQLENLNNVEQRAVIVKNQLNQQQNRLQQSMQRSSTEAEGLNRNVQEMSESASADAINLEQTAKNSENLSASFDELTTRIKQFLSVGVVFTEIRNIIKDTYNDVKNLDKAFASIAMVTDYSVDEMWQSYGDYADMAAELGQSTQSVIESSALFYQQGLNTADSLELTVDTMKLATLADIDYAEATQEMTAA